MSNFWLTTALGLDAHCSFWCFAVAYWLWCLDWWYKRPNKHQSVYNK